MSEIDNSVRALRFLHNVSSVVEIANVANCDASVLTAALNLAETYLSLNPSTISKSECHNPVFFLHTLWCNPDDGGIERAVKEFKVLLDEESRLDQIEILTSLQNVLLTAKQVPAIIDDLHDPCQINGLISSALLYVFMTSGADFDELEEWDCLDIFVAEAWGANDEEKRSAIASTLQAHIEKSSVESSESIFEDLLNGRITTPNTFGTEHKDNNTHC